MRTLYLGLVPGKDYGWGIASKYLAEELSKLIPVRLLIDEMRPEDDRAIPGPVLHILKNELLVPQFAARGTKNYGYVFFEQELTDESVKNAEQYELVLTGSRWCRNRMLDRGIKNTAVLHQGVDTERFFPGKKIRTDSLFRLFSGGKFEFRKGQDIVLRAFKTLQDRYPDLQLCAAWYNYIPATMGMMEQSNQIACKIPKPLLSRSHALSDAEWQEFIQDLCVTNGIDPDRVEVIGRRDNSEMRNVYLDTDLGVFPNRCESGTNLVMMEYMACGKPVIAADSTGQRDVLDQRCAALLTRMETCHIYDRSGRSVSAWVTPNVDDVVRLIEQFYHQRDQMAALGVRAAEHVQQFTWAACARKLLDLIEWE